MSDSYDDIRNDTGNETPTIDEGDETSGSSPTSLPSVSRTQLALVVGVAVAVAVAVWWIRSNGGASSVEDVAASVADYDLEAADRAENDRVDSDGTRYYVPSDPERELDKDEAVYAALREDGVMNGGTK